MMCVKTNILPDLSIWRAILVVSDHRFMWKLKIVLHTKYWTKLDMIKCAFWGALRAEVHGYTYLYFLLMVKFLQIYTLGVHQVVYATF